MLAFYILGFSLILESSGRQAPGAPTGITVYRTATPGQYLVQPAPRTAPPEVPPGFSQIAVVVLPRHPGPFLHTPIPPRTAPEPSEDGYGEDPNLYYRQSIGTQESLQNIIKPQTLAYAQLLPYPPIKKKFYSKQKISIHQFLKEVTPTTQTAYSEQQAASLRYAQAAPPHTVEQELQKLTTQRVAPHPLSIPFFIQSEIQDPNQPQQYQQLIHPQQYVQAPPNLQAQPNIQNQQFIQPHPYPPMQLQYAPREAPIAQQPKYQPTHLQPQNTNAGLTYIPINPVMFQKPLVDDDTPSPSPKSTIYVSQKTLKKYQPPQSISEEESDDHVEKPEIPIRKVVRPQPRQYFPVQPQQILVPIIPQQPTAVNEDIPTQFQPQLVKYHQIQHLQPVQPQPAPEQQVFLQVRPKKVLPQQPQLLRQQSQQHIVAYHQIPIQQPIQQGDPRAYQHLQPTELVNLQRQPIFRYLVQPQILTYQPVQPVHLRQPQPQPQPQIQPEPVEYESNQEDTEQPQELQQVDRNEEKQDVQQQEPPQRQPLKLKKTSLRSRKYRPARIQAENEEEPQNENQETQQDNQEEFRIQYPDGLKPQATTYAGLRYRRPIQTNSRQLIRNKDRAVQIIDEENEEYK